MRPSCGRCLEGRDSGALRPEGHRPGRCPSQQFDCRGTKLREYARVTVTDRNTFAVDCKIARPGLSLPFGYTRLDVAGRFCSWLQWYYIVERLGDLDPIAVVPASNRRRSLQIKTWQIIAPSKADLFMLPTNPCFRSGCSKERAS